MIGDVPRPYLFVKHSEGWNVDRCTRWMDAAGLPVEFCYPTSGQRFPDPEDYAGVVVFGGRWFVGDAPAETWIVEEQRFIEACLEAGTPYFGICLGAQMLAHVLGARVCCHPEGLREVGFHEVLPSADAPEFMRAPLHVMQWHREGFELPDGATQLATAPGGSDTAFPNQAFGLNDQVVGVQFHPEVNPDVLKIWHQRNRERNPEDLTDAERSLQASDAVRFDAEITAWLDHFLSGWTARAIQAT